MSSTISDQPSRWQNYYLQRGQGFLDFWNSYLNVSSRRLLIILGYGFDPRMCHGARVILASRHGAQCDFITLDFDEGPASPSQRYREFREANGKKLDELVQLHGCGKTEKKIQVFARDGSRSISQGAAKVIGSLEDVADYSDVVVDISALPRGIYFPLLGKLLSLLDQGKQKAPDAPRPCLHVIVSENAGLDSRIRDDGIVEDADYVRGFGSIDRVSNESLPKIWIPVLGERQEEQLSRIRLFVNPTETCPLLPFPASNPRRGDDLLQSYRRFLFDDLGIEPRNLLYADEGNPFQAYRQLRRTICQYRESLDPLGGCKAVVSALSSKLLSLGVLLAVYELRQLRFSVGIAQVETLGYAIDDPIADAAALDDGELFVLRLA